MATYQENLRTARDNLAAELANETTRRLALTAAGHPPPTTYSFGGQNFDWNGYLRVMKEAIDGYNELLAGEDIYEIHERGY